MVLAKNSLEGKAAGYLERIENLLDDLDSKRGSYMAECKVVREDIKEIYIEAKDNGIPVRSLKGLVKHRELEKKQNAIAAGFDIDEAAAFNTLVDTLGDLGMAAAMRVVPKAPKEADSAADDERDFRPTNLRNTDLEDLHKVGRGPQP